MKRFKFSKIILLAILLSVLLSACAGGTAYKTWPGLSAGQDTVYLAMNNGVFAVKDGSLVWRFPAEADNSKAFFAAPGISEDQLVIGDYSNTIYGVNPQNAAAPVWSTTPKEGGHIVARPLVVEDTVLVPSSDHSLYAFDKAGKQLWKFTTANILWGQPASDGEIVYLPAMDHNLYALNLSDGSLIWKKDMGGPLPGTPVVAEDGTVFVITLDGKVHSLKDDQLTVVWQLPVEGEVWSSPVYNEGILYFGSSNGKVYAISTESGAAPNPVWEVDLGSPVIAGGALFDDKLIFPTELGEVHALSLEGQKVWNPPAAINGKLYTTPAVAGDVVVVAAMENENVLTALDASGVQKWSFVFPK